MIQSIVSMGDKKLTKKEMAKLGLGFFIGACADLTVSALIGHLLPSSTGIRRLIRGIGIFVIGLKVGEDIENHFYKVYDETESTIAEAKEEFAKDIQESSVEEAT